MTRLRHHATVALPLATSPPAFVVATEQLVHLLAMDAANRRTVHVALDRAGAPASRPAALPISLASAGVCGEEVVVTGVHETEGVRWAMGLDAGGAIRWETALPLATSGLVWTAPTSIAGEPAIVWEVENGATAELGVATLGGGRLTRIATAPQPRVAVGLHVAASDAGLFVLRGRGASQRADILRVERGGVTARAQTATNAQAIAAVGDRLAVLSWTPETLLLDWLDTSPASLGVAETLATAPAPSWIRYAALHAADENRVAVSYLVGERGGLIEGPGGRSEPGESARQFLGRYDGKSHTLADVVEVAPAGTAWGAAAWLGDRLFLVHGETGAALSVFEVGRE